MRVGVVIITIDHYWSVTRFADETILNTFISLVQKEFGKRIKTLDIVQLDPSNPLPPPDGFEATLENFRNRMLWCPWCGEMRQFGPSTDFPEDLFCGICHISTSDYHIKRFNRLDYFGSGILGIRGHGRKKGKKSKERVMKNKLIHIEDEDEE